MVRAVVRRRSRLAPRRLWAAVAAIAVTGLIVGLTALVLSLAAVKSPPTVGESSWLGPDRTPRDAIRGVEAVSSILPVLTEVPFEAPPVGALVVVRVSAPNVAEAIQWMRSTGEFAGRSVRLDPLKGPVDLDPRRCVVVDSCRWLSEWEASGGGAYYLFLEEAIPLTSGDREQGVVACSRILASVAIEPPWVGVSAATDGFEVGWCQDGTSLYLWILQLGRGGS